MSKRICAHEKGFSLVELVLVSAVVIFLATLILNLPSAISSINKSRHRSIAKDITARQIDYLRKQLYAVGMANGTSAFADPSLISLPFSSAQYSIEDCPAQTCGSGNEAKMVKVTVSWNESGDAKSVELTTIMAEGGIGQ